MLLVPLGDDAMKILSRVENFELAVENLEVGFSAVDMGL